MIIFNFKHIDGMPKTLPGMETYLRADASVPENVNPALHPIVDAVCALMNFTTRVTLERIHMPFTKQWRMADVQTSCVFRQFIELISLWGGPEMQRTFVANKLRGLERACDLKLWRTFCGRTHKVPQEMIATLQSEISKIKASL